MKSSLQLTSSTPIHKEENTKLVTIWQSLQDHNDSIEFRNPVDYKGNIAHMQPWVFSTTRSMLSIPWTSVPSVANWGNKGTGW